MHRFVGWAVIAACLLLAVLAVAAQEGEAQVVGGDEAGLREMLARIVGQMGYPGGEATVLVGEIPEELPLALPKDARIIGSIIRQGTPGSDVMLQMNMPPQEAVTHVKDVLETDGWTSIASPSYPTGGFTNQETYNTQFCNSDDSVMINVSARGVNEATDLHMYIINEVDPVMCAALGETGYLSNDPYRLLPQLQTPAEVQLLPERGGGGSGGGMPGFRSASTTAFLESSLALSDMMTAYHDQLLEMGWIESGAENGDQSAWSGWTFADETGKLWGGTLSIIASQTGAGEYMATILVEEIPDES